MPVDRYQTQTNYRHPQDSNLLDVHRAMEYNTLGQPVIRVTSGASPTANDAFGRLRVSQPFTLFDSFHRYQDNGRITQYTTGTSTSTHSVSEGCITMTVGTNQGDAIYRESSRVFAYQPGKSLSVMQTFCMNPAKPGLRQRQGYFDVNNGIFLERSGDQVSFNIRTTTYTGTPEIREKVFQQDWNIDPLNGSGVSTKVLNLDVTQIMFIDIEWLGVGSIRVGFVIDGEFTPVHIFHHANRVGNVLPYMATACLPVRAELENTAVTDSSSTYKLICTTILSEGGYEIRGRSRAAGHGISSPYSLTSKDIVYPVFSMRLKNSRLGGIVLPKNFSLGIDKAANYRYTVVSGGITAGGTWVDAGVNDSSVEYNLTAASITAGTVVELGYINASNQASVAPSLAEFPFQFQLERNSFNGQATEFTVCVETDASTGPKAWCSVDWEEIT
jgi:hypothetical protein